MLFALLVVKLTFLSFVPRVEVADDEFDVARIAWTCFTISFLDARCLADRETCRHYCCWTRDVWRLGRLADIIAVEREISGC